MSVEQFAINIQLIDIVVIWSNVSFHRAAQVREWFQDHPQVSVLHPLRSSFQLGGGRYMNGTHRAGSHCSRPWRRLVAMWVFSVCTGIKTFCCIFLYCFIFNYEKSRPTLGHFTKGEMTHSPESLSFISCVPFLYCVLHFALQCAVNVW